MPAWSNCYFAEGAPMMLSEIAKVLSTRIPEFVIIVHEAWLGSNILRWGLGFVDDSSEGSQKLGEPLAPKSRGWRTVETPGEVCVTGSLSNDDQNRKRQQIEEGAHIEGKGIRLSLEGICNAS
jgi:hypothetical protein